MPAPKLDGPTAIILRMLADTPGTAFAVLAKAAYGKDDLEHRLKVGNIVGSLFRRGTLRRHGKRRGSYAVKADAKRARADQLAG
jgi:hypothetical protein